MFGWRKRKREERKARERGVEFVWLWIIFFSSEYQESSIFWALVT
jgi:hypothetical protein